MQKVNLYRYEDESGRVTITPTPRAETDTVSRMRLIADEGHILTNGTTETPAVDVMLDEVEDWVETPDAEATETDYINALEELGVNFNE